VSAQNRSEWRRSVTAQCIHLDAGWIKVKEPGASALINHTGCLNKN